MNHSVAALVARFGYASRIECHDAIAIPEVTVIIPTHNCLQYLPVAIRSIQMQRVDNVEILILNDGSTDETHEYLALAKQCDERIKFVDLPGLGVAKARNHGLELARGRFIAFLDADDHWCPGKLTRQLAFHRANPEVVLSFSNYLHFDPQDRYLGDCFNYWPHFSRLLTKTGEGDDGGYRSLGDDGLAALFAENVIGTSCVMIHPDAMGQKLFFDHSLRSAEDWDYWLRCAINGPVGCTPSVDMAYLMRPGSETSRVKQRLEYMAVIIRRHLNAVMPWCPVALARSLSRLLTGYGEYYRGSSLTKSVLCHFTAWSLSPSKRLFRAFAADCRDWLLQVFKLRPRHVAKCDDPS